MAALTLFLIWRIHLGLFHDEVQLINLGKLLADGDSFVQITGYGMSHYLIRPLMVLYHRLAGSYDGVFLYMRYVFVLIQLLVAIYTYLTLRLFWSERQASAASAMVMLFVFSYYATAYKAVMFWCTMLTVLFLLRWEKTRKIRYLILSALALSADVLGYPPVPALLIIPVTRFLLRDRTSARRTIALYWGTCALCAMAFLLPALAVPADPGRLFCRFAAGRQGVQIRASQDRLCRRAVSGGGGRGPGRRAQRLLRQARPEAVGDFERPAVAGADRACRHETADGAGVPLLVCLPRLLSAHCLSAQTRPAAREMRAARRHFVL